MLEIKQGTIQYTDGIVPLILASAPELLAYIFGSTEKAASFLAHAVKQNDGQFSAVRHKIAIMDNKLVGCVSIWHTDMPPNFHDATLKSIATFLSPEQMAHVIAINPLLVTLFPPPTLDELCFGHLSVRPDYQGVGVASKLLSYIVRQAKYLKKNTIVLDVDECNQDALAFYEKWHFKTIERALFEPTRQHFLRLNLKV